MYLFAFHSLLRADVAAATVLITMGALLGRTSYIQLLLIGIIEIAVFTGNSYLGSHIFKVNFCCSKFFALCKDTRVPEPEVIYYARVELMQHHNITVFDYQSDEVKEERRGVTARHPRSHPLNTAIIHTK